MKRKFFLLVMLLLTAMIISGCDITGITPPISENPELTLEEIELIREYGYDSEYTVRWPDGYVDVYDATGFSQMQEVINKWNSAIGGKVILRLSNNPNSQVKVYYKSMFGDYCGNFDIKWNEDYALSTIDVQISNNAFFCGYPSSKYALYLFMFKNVAGFDGWTTKGVPYEEWTDFTTINDTMKKMVKALHKVPPGYCLLPKPEIVKVEGVKWQAHKKPNGFMYTKYPYLLVDYFGKSLVPPPSDDNDYEYPDSIEKGSRFCLIISGENFGEEKESISLEGRGQITNKLQYFTININSWSDNKIKVFPYFNLEDLDFEPVKEAVLTVYRPDGKKTEYPVDIIPSIGRQPFGQCTWWTYRRRLEVSKGDIDYIPYPGNAYSNNFILNQNYVPEKYDILIWTTEHHQAFVEEVINKEMGTVRISEYNVKYSEELYFGEEGYETGENKTYKFSPDSSPADFYYR